MIAELGYCGAMEAGSGAKNSRSGGKAHVQVSHPEKRIRQKSERNSQEGLLHGGRGKLAKRYGCDTPGDGSAKGEKEGVLAFCVQQLVNEDKTSGDCR
jgi:hypothetical protein